MYENHAQHFKALFTNALALEVGNIPMPEQIKIDVTDNKQKEVTFKLEIVWKGQRMGAAQTFLSVEVPPYKELPEHEQDGGLLFTLQMLDNPNLLEEHRAYWLFLNQLSGEFAHRTAQFFRENWEYVVLMVNAGIFPENFYFEVQEVSPKFTTDMQGLVAYWVFPSQESAFQASLKINIELGRWRTYMNEAYVGEPLRLLCTEHPQGKGR